jgi:hypothetical protein
MGLARMIICHMQSFLTIIAIKLALRWHHLKLYMEESALHHCFGVVLENEADMGTKEEVKPNFRTPPR